MAVKEELPHGSFEDYLECEFGWNERTAQRLMSVVLRFVGRQRDRLSVSGLGVSVAYALAAASVPDEAREEALARDEEGVRVTLAVAQEIIDRAKNRHRDRDDLTDHLLRRLGGLLERYRAQCPREGLPRLADHLSVFAAQLRLGRTEE